jgi:hypothetical protein
MTRALTRAFARILVQFRLTSYCSWTTLASTKGAKMNASDRVIVSCTSCSRQLRLPIGKTGSVRCPGCGSVFEASTKLPADTVPDIPETPSSSSTSTTRASLGEAYLYVGAIFANFAFFGSYWPALRGIWYGCPLTEWMYFSAIITPSAAWSGIVRAFLWLPGLVMWFGGFYGDMTFWQWLFPGLLTTGVCGF